MVEHCVNLAYRKGEDLLFIQCEPATSAPFWQSMGFTLVPGSETPKRAYRILERTHALPVVGTSEEVLIRFYPEEKKWNDEIEAYQQTVVAGKMLPNGVIQLGRRISFHEGAYPHVRDVVVEAKVNGVFQFCDKAKYSAIQARGVTQCKNGWFVDQLLPFACDAIPLFNAVASGDL